MLLHIYSVPRVLPGNLTETVHQNLHLRAHVFTPYLTSAEIVCQEHEHTVKQSLLGPSHLIIMQNLTYSLRAVTVIFASLIFLAAMAKQTSSIDVKEYVAKYCLCRQQLR